MASDDIAISVKNLTKKYRIFGHPGDRIKQALTFGRVRFHREFTALQDVSFEIRKGETVGIIGRNGSGKSTLLQLLCGILKPTSGSVQVNGRVSALLELGAGFNPEFTGRENVFFQGAIMGISEECMTERFGKVAAFAEIGEFVDQPVRTYSSGMFVRLAFATAIHIEPDILIVDEALAVGDAAFQSKCMDKLRELQEDGLTIILVTHSRSIIADLCNRVVLLRKGHLVSDGTPAEVLVAYEEEQVLLDRQIILDRKAFSSGLYIISVEVFDDLNRLRNHFQMHECLTIQVSLSGLLDLERFCIGMEIRSVDGFVLWSATSRDLKLQVISVASGNSTYIQWIFFADMAPGTYVVSIGAGEVADGIYRRHDRLHHAAEITIQDSGGAHGYLPLKPRIQMVDAAL